MTTPLDSDLNETHEAFGRDHDRLRRALMASLADGAGQRGQRGRPVHTRRFIRGTIMKSRMTKLTAAAVIIIAMAIGVSQFGGAPDIASTAFARVRATVSDVPCMHLSWSTSDNERGDRKAELELWFLPERKIVAESTDSMVYWRNHLNGQRKEYEKASNTLTIYYGIDEELSDDNGPPWSYLIAIFGREFVCDMDITQSTQDSHGELLNVYEFAMNEDGGTAHFKILAGIDDDLPRTISIEAEDREKGRNIFVEGVCRYPANGPEDIYDLGVPKDATVIDNRPTVEAKELADICSAYRENFSSYIVVIVNGAPSSRLRGVYVNHIDGYVAKYGRSNKYLHLSYGIMPGADLKRDLLEEEIEQDFDSFLDCARNDPNLIGPSVSLWDGKYRHTIGRRKGENTRYPTYRKVRGHGTIMDIGSYAWPIFLPTGKKFQDEYAEENGLIGLKVSGRRLYFDPEHDYIVRRVDGQRQIRDVTELARTENGLWYPRRIELTIIEKDTTGAEVSRQVTNVDTIFVKMVSEFPEGTFDPDNLPRTIE